MDRCSVWRNVGQIRLGNGVSRHDGCFSLLGLKSSIVKNSRSGSLLRGWSAWNVNSSAADRHKKLPEPSQREREVVSGSSQNGIDGISFASEIIPVHSVFTLEVSNDGFDRRSSSHLAFVGGLDAALQAAGEDPQLVTFGSIISVHRAECGNARCRSSFPYSE